MTDIFLQLSRNLRKNQSSSRFRHSMAVARLAGILGRQHGWNPSRARLAGLLHDWSKEWAPSRLIHYSKKNRLAIPDMKFIQKTHPNLLHAYVGADVVRKKGWITNNDDLKAIASHTLGSINMSLEEKILYVADLASLDRRFKEAVGIRQLAMKDLHAGFRAALAVKLTYQIRKNKPIHPLPIRVWNQINGFQ